MESARDAVLDDVTVIDQIATAHRKQMLDKRGGEMFLKREAGAISVSERAATAIDDEDSLVVVGTYDGVVFGYGLVRYETLVDGGSLARLEDFIVEPEARAVGIGEAMMNRIVDQATSRGCVGIDSSALPGDRETKNFFESFGLKARMLVVHRPL